MEHLLKELGSCVHVENSGRGRLIAHHLACGPDGPHSIWYGGERLWGSHHNPWLFEGEETFPELGGMKQKVQIGNFVDFGRGLVIDGMSQLAEAIEPVYTSALIFPAALTARSRRRWLIAGGGDGAAPREALAFRDTEYVKLVDISRMVIEKTQELIPSFWSNCQNDSRLDNDPRDVFAYMRETSEQFDIVISDLTDPEDEEYTPFSESTADHLYTEEGLRLFAKCLAPDGVFVMQAQEFSLIRWEGHKRLRRLLHKVFPRVYSYRVFVEFFGYWESFLIAYNGTSSVPYFLPAPDFNNRMERYAGELRSYLSYRDLEALFAIPPELRLRFIGV